MEFGETMEPVSPTGQYLNSSVLSLSIIAVLEIGVTINDSQTMSLLENLFLPINPRFSSIMVSVLAWFLVCLLVWLVGLVGFLFLFFIYAYDPNKRRLSSILSDFFSFIYSVLFVEISYFFVCTIIQIIHKHLTKRH